VLQKLLDEKKELTRYLRGTRVQRPREWFFITRLRLQRDRFWCTACVKHM